MTVSKSLSYLFGDSCNYQMDCDIKPRTSVISAKRLFGFATAARDAPSPWQTAKFTWRACSFQTLRKESAQLLASRGKDGKTLPASLPFVACGPGELWLSWNFEKRREISGLSRLNRKRRVSRRSKKDPFRCWCLRRGSLGGLCKS